MRGKIDTPMSETANIALLERIVAAQRKILAEAVNQDVTQIPQLWCLYKEVQEYYEKGMRVPDDVTLLWSDDNWGDIRRLPTPEERKRPGGAGVYYHFDYVGGPRNYKWIDTNTIPKVWEQMNLAHRYGADKVWIVNVGDLKPMEFVMEFFLTMARDPDAIRKEDLEKYTVAWASREFGPTYAAQIAKIILETGRLNGRRKPELLGPETYSQTNYDESDRVLAEFRSLEREATEIGGKLGLEYKSAFYQLVIHPVRCARVVNEMYMSVAKNAYYAAHGWASANEEAAKIKALYAEDAAVTQEYHSINGGKWNHFMDQTHIGYTYWQQPDTNVMPKVKEIQAPEAAGLAISTNVLSFDRFGQKVRTIGLFNLGRTPFSFRASCADPWVRIEPSSGTVATDSPIRFSIDWDLAPVGIGNSHVSIEGAGGAETVKVETHRQDGDLHGFIEGDGVVAIEAEHTRARSTAGGVRWETIPGYGRTLSGVESFPVEFAPFEPGKGPELQYDFTSFQSGPVTLDAVVGPSLAFQPTHGMRVAVAIDDEKPQLLDIAASYLSRDWETSVEDSVRHVKSPHLLSKPGRHTLRIWAVDPGVVVERFVLDLGGLLPSYLGPPESYRSH
jgi:hypothetical protein